MCMFQVSQELVKVEEDKVRVVWEPAGLELWLQKNSHKGIQVDSYDVTIFPAETVQNSKTLQPKDKDKRSGNYTAWFFDLQGGRTEYVITIACVIGKSRMKGERTVTTLLPYGAVKHRNGLLKTTGTDEVEISWEPPKGGFTKYLLSVDPNVTSLLSPRKNYGMEPKGVLNPLMFYANNMATWHGNMASLPSSFSTGSMNDLDKVNNDISSTRELSNLLTVHISTLIKFHLSCRSTRSVA